MKKGDVVIGRRNRKLLHCGSSIYTHAIVMKVEPLILVSEETDMRWNCIDSNDLIVLCQVHPDIVKKCEKRIQKVFNNLTLPSASGKGLDNLAELYAMKRLNPKKVLWIFNIKESDGNFRKRITKEVTNERYGTTGKEII